MTDHTPTPWGIIAGDDYYITAEGYPKEFIGHFKSDDNGGYVAVVGNRPKDFGEANAAFIVKAVNNHEALVKALEVLLEEATSFGVSGVYFDEECMGHKGPALARAVLDAVGNAGSSS